MTKRITINIDALEEYVIKYFEERFSKGQQLDTLKIGELEQLEYIQMKLFWRISNELKKYKINNQ